MSDQYRNYNDFSVGAIYKYDNQTPSQEGWLNDESGDTPINADNLNAMLQMLIYIRNVIGKTDDFETKINSSTDNASKPDTSGEENTKSLATYIQDVVAAIIGTDDDIAGSDTVKGIKKYTAKEIEDLRSLILEELDEINCGSSTELIDNGGDN